MTSNLQCYKTNCPIAIFNILGTKLDRTELICGVLLCSKTFISPLGVKRHLTHSDPVTDGSPPWCPLVIEALSVSVNCWSLVRVCLMTPSLAGSPAVINLTPLKTAHYGMHLICCQARCVEESLCGRWMMCYLCQCYVNQGGCRRPKPNGTTMRSATLARSIRLCWTAVERTLWIGSCGGSIVQVQVSILVWRRMAERE